jgi:DNA-binding NarL/FixJ family response regulator
MSLLTASNPPALTSRESEVLRLMAKRYRNSRIANLLGITVGTVQRHAHNIFQKLGSANRTEATRWAVRNGVIEPEDE